jgi:hypothetical protein
MLAFGCAFFISSGVFQSAAPAIASQASYWDRAALIPLWPARDRKYASAISVPITITGTKHNSEFPKVELRIPFYGINIGRFAALSGEIRRLEAIAFGIYRRLSPSSEIFRRCF